MWTRAWIFMGLCLLYTAPVYCQTSLYQLRIYKLHAGNEQHFHERFSRQCMPIMRRYGFDIVFTPKRRDRPRGVCLSPPLEGSRDAGISLEEFPCRYGMDRDQKGDFGKVGRSRRRCPGSFTRHVALHA
jgi:hypothetical protein